MHRVDLVGLATALDGAQLAFAAEQARKAASTEDATQRAIYLSLAGREIIARRSEALELLMELPRECGCSMAIVAARIRTLAGLFEQLLTLLNTKGNDERSTH